MKIFCLFKVLVIILCFLMLITIVVLTYLYIDSNNQYRELKKDYKSLEENVTILQESDHLESLISLKRPRINYKIIVINLFAALYFLI